MKQRPRALRDWPQHGDIDVDYATGRTLSGEWKPMPSEEPRDRYNRPIPGGPQYMVNQWDKVLE